MKKFNITNKVTKLKKGQWVTLANESKYGNIPMKVIKGGQKAELGYDFAYKGYGEVSFVAILIPNNPQSMINNKVHNIELTDDESPMSDYAITKYKYFEEGHGDTETFHAVITFKGKSVITIENDGWGGCNMVHNFNHKDKTNYINEFYEAVGKWNNLYSDFKDKDDAIWFDYETKSSIYGFTPIQYNEHQNELFGKRNTPRKV
jgi:hypothetical protein